MLFYDFSLDHQMAFTIGCMVGEDWEDLGTVNFFLKILRSSLQAGEAVILRFMPDGVKIKVIFQSSLKSWHWVAASLSYEVDFWGRLLILKTNA